MFGLDLHCDIEPPASTWTTDGSGQTGERTKGLDTSQVSLGKLISATSFDFSLPDGR